MLFNALAIEQRTEFDKAHNFGRVRLDGGHCVFWRGPGWYVSNDFYVYGSGHTVTAYYHVGSDRDAAPIGKYVSCQWYDGFAVVTA